MNQRTPTPTFPWPALMHFGLSILRLPPHEFWRSTPRELFAAAGFPSSLPMLRQNLDQLMKEHPDAASE